ncbi:hypothetical protein AHF37_08954 [Paragonimus kellicotti]|nr:hypothetical protein AHF37_08954 [Paragonimus kellicotti]
MLYSRAATERFDMTVMNANNETVGVGGTTLTFVEPLVPANVTFVCPNRTTLGLTIVCNLTMNAGSHLRITTQTFTGQLGTSRVPEPYQDWMQVTAMRLPTGMTSCPTTKLVIAGSSARYSGSIFELSVNLANAGVLEVMLLRVRCSSGSYSYTQDVCTTVSSDGINCSYSTTNQVLVGSQMACSSTDLADCGAGLRRIRLDKVINVEPYDYEVIEVDQQISFEHVKLRYSTFISVFYFMNKENGF